MAAWILAFTPQCHQAPPPLLFPASAKACSERYPESANTSFGQFPQIVPDRFNHRQQLAVVSRIVGQPVGYDELAVAVDGGLRVVAQCPIILPSS